MQRRAFLITCGAPLLAQRNNTSDPKNSYPEDQHPESARGRAIADFARSLKIQRGIVYVERPEGKLTLDVYEPRKRSPEPIPAILAFGFSAFRKNETQYRWDLDHLLPASTPNLYPPTLARNRVVVVANLRLSTEAKWPAQIHDVKCAMRWVRKLASDLRIDSQRIGAFGASASANMSALLALTADTNQLDDPTCDPSVSTRVKAVVCLSGPFDWEYYKNVDPGNKSLFVDVLPPFLGSDDKLYHEASPSTYVHPGAPPFLLVHGVQDQRVPYSQMGHFANLLKKAGDTVETISVNNYQHGPLPGKEPEPGYEVLDQQIYRFYDRYLDGRG